MGKTLKLKRVIIFGGNIAEIDSKICEEICDTDFIICADAGYKFVLANNIHPDLVVGDFDSAPYPEMDNCEIIKLPTHKNDTDLHFAVNLALERGFKNFVLTGVTGGRLDHTVASISTLDSLSDKAESCFIRDLSTTLFIVNSSILINKPEFDCYFSVFSLAETSEGVCIEGAEYPLCNATLDSNFPLGVSNEFKGDAARISLKKGKLLVTIVKKD